MENTGLTIGGFTQPAVARALIEIPSNIEKGLSTRFLWVIPKPRYSKFASLEPVNKDFTESLGKRVFFYYHACTQQFFPPVTLFSGMWSTSTSPVHQFVVTESCEQTFSKMHDDIQEKLQDIAGMDDLLSGMKLGYYCT